MKRTARKSKSSTMATTEKHNNKIKLYEFILISVLVVLLFIWLIIKPMTQNVPDVTSLKVNWNAMDISAHNLKNDSYLTHVDIILNRNEPYGLMAQYESPSAPDKVILVRVDRSNKVDAFWTNISSSTVGMLKPISQKDLVIDSQNALNIFAKDEIINSCLKSSSDSIDMYLDSTLTEFPTWQLQTMNCLGNGKLKTYLLDARTGEVINP